MLDDSDAVKALEVGFVDAPLTKIPGTLKRQAIESYAEFCRDDGAKRDGVVTAYAVEIDAKNESGIVRHGAQPAVDPRSVATMAPCIDLASSEARNAKTPAMSSALDIPL